MRNSSAGEGISPSPSGDSVDLQRSAGTEEIGLRALAATMMGKGFATHVLWTFKTDEDMHHPPAQSPDGTHIYFSDRSNTIYCTGENGALQWKTRLPGTIHEPPVPAADGSVIARLDKTLIKLDAAGKVKWGRTFKYPRGKPLVASDGTVFTSEQIKTSEGKEKYYLLALDPKDGATKSQIETRGSCSEAPIEGKDGRIYVTDDAHYIYCVTREGHLEWSKKKAGIGSGKLSTGSEGTIFSTDTIPGEKRGDMARTILFALNPDGSKKWIYETDAEPLKHPPAISPDGHLYINLWHGLALHALSPEGRKDWEYPLSSSTAGEAAPSVGPDGTIYVADGNNLVALKADGSLLFREKFENPLLAPPVFTSDGSACIAQGQEMICLKDRRKFIEDEQARRNTSPQLIVEENEDEINVGGIRLEKH